jgi:hypothetical protein
MRSTLGRERPVSAATFLFGVILLLATRAGAATEVERLREELSAAKQQLSATQNELGATQAALEALTRRVDAMQAAPAPAPAPVPAVPAAPRTAEATARLAPVNADNPAISFAVDTELSSDTESSWESIGYADGVNFSLQNAELFISAPIDPFLRGYASINASSDEGFDVEEAALVTTALPWNLTVKGGRFFADFGRLSHWHNEALPFVNRPPSIERIIGGESISEGAEVSWLAPIEHFVQLTGGLYNAVGAENTEDVNENGFFGRRDWSELTFLGRAQTYYDLTDTLNVELGGTWLGIPHESNRNLWGTDVTFRHQPGTSSLYQGLVWGTEWMWNRQKFTERDDDGAIVSETRDNRTGGYTYAEAYLGRAFSLGARFDYSEAVEGDDDLAKTVSPFITWKPSEFQRLRFQFDNTWGDQATNQRFTLQWTAFIGSHSHGFAQR